MGFQCTPIGFRTTTNVVAFRGFWKSLLIIRLDCPEHAYKEEKTPPGPIKIFPKGLALLLLDKRTKRRNIKLLPFRFGSHLKDNHMAHELPQTLGPANPQIITIAEEPLPASIL